MKQKPDHLWKPGQSGNPKGRPPGSKDKLGEAFVSALLDDFEENGSQAIVTCRTEKPDVYLQVIARVIPKDVNVKGEGVSAFLKLWEAISDGLASRLVEEPGQSEALRDQRPAGHA